MIRLLGVESVLDSTAKENNDKSRNTADPYWIDYMACLIAKETCTAITVVQTLPYSKILSYYHCIMRNNGNDTRWCVADTAQADDDMATINEMI